MNTWTEMERNINKKICIMAFIFLSGFLPFSSCFVFKATEKCEMYGEKSYKLRRQQQKNVHNC